MHTCFICLFVEFYRWFNFTDELRSETIYCTFFFRHFSRFLFFSQSGERGKFYVCMTKICNLIFSFTTMVIFSPLVKKFSRDVQKQAILSLPFTNYSWSAHDCSLSWFVSHFQTLFFLLTQLKFNINFRQLKDTFVLESSHCKIFVQIQGWALRVQTELKRMQKIQTTLVTHSVVLEKHPNIYEWLLWRSILKDLTGLI